MAILITGGAGYIGSMFAAYIRPFEDVVVVDSLVRGVKSAIPDGTPTYFMDLANSRYSQELEDLLREHEIDTVVHFAGYANARESLSKPACYYRNNVQATFNLLNAMRKVKVERMVFSSSCSVYGNTGREPVRERDPINPISAYGRTKAACESMIRDYEEYGINAIVYRYFNAAGATSQRGEATLPAYRLIPRLVQIALGKVEGPFRIYGNYHATPDGTCVRDYIHVLDLCRAHEIAIKALRDYYPTSVFNLGTGEGYSVEQVVRAVEKATGVDIPVEMVDRVAGDPPVAIADARLAYCALNWKPSELSKLDTIVESVVNWEKNRRYYIGISC